jgi:hypothetical protein
MATDLFGVGFALLGAFMLNLRWWSWVGLVAFTIYETVMFGLVFVTVETANPNPD